MKSSQKNRPSYTSVDARDREAHLDSRNNILSKSFVTDLWMKVITRAIDDVALYKVMRHKGRKLKEEELLNEESAWEFLFNDDYRIPMGDYLVDVVCPVCNTISKEYISDIVGQYFGCPKCKEVTKNPEFTITEEQKMKEISLRELISLWGIENIEQFRVGVSKRINEIVGNKLSTIEARKHK
jgi:hypothetical protein